MIIYFSATGNSEYVAKAIADRCEDKAVSINSYMKKGTPECFNSDKPWVFVFPIYLSIIVKPFADYIRKCTFEGSTRAYFIGTCASEVGATANEAEIICQELGLEFCGVAKAVMPQSYIALFKMTEPEECDRRYKAVLDEMDRVAKLIMAEEKLDMKLNSKFMYSVTKKVEKLYYKSFTKTRKFYATDSCIGCGMCESLCAQNNIVIQNNRPVWKGSCMHCMACINHCPKAAIEYGRKTRTKKRYICPKYSK